MGMHEFAFNSQARTVHLDGVDIARHIAAIEIVAEAPGPPEVTLHLSLAHNLDISGMAQVSVAVPDAAGAVRAFLEAVDTKALEAAALERSEGTESLTPVMLDILKEWAQ